MKHLKIALSFICLVALCDCRKTQTPNDQVAAAPVPAVRAKGIDSGTAAAKTIGPAGGTLVSANGRVSIDVPAGALTANTVITVQPITSTLPLSVGTGAFRITPEGLQFAKPVTIRFTYTDQDLAGSSPDFLYVAYQDTAGIWNTYKTQQVDTVQKTISIQSSHFSDWAVFEKFKLVVSDYSVAFNKPSYMHVVHNSFADGKPAEYTISDTTSDALALLGEGQVENWRLAGQGQFVHSGGYATYTSPSSTPNPNPVIISVDIVNFLDNNGSLKNKVTLVAPVYVGDEFISVNFKNNVYSSQALTANAAAIIGIGGGVSVNISAAALGLGTFSFGSIGGSNALVAVKLNSEINKPYGVFYCSDCMCTSLLKTAGTVVITSFGPVGTYIEGRFDGQLVFSANCINDIQPISGTFRVKRTG